MKMKNNILKEPLVYVLLGFNFIIVAIQVVVFVEYGERFSVHQSYYQSLRAEDVTQSCLVQMIALIPILNNTIKVMFNIVATLSFMNLFFFFYYFVQFLWNRRIKSNPRANQ